MRAWLKAHSSKDWLLSLFLGLGLVLFVWHTKAQPGLDIVFLPHLGLAIIVCVVTLVLLKGFSLGSKFIWIPLAVICGFIALNSIIYSRLENFAFAFIIFGVYLTSRKLGDKLFYSFAPFVVLEAVSLVIIGLNNPGMQQGGMLSTGNYDIATGFLLFGSLMYPGKHRWVLLVLSGIGIWFTGAFEAPVILAVVAIGIFVKKDFGRKLYIIIAAVVLVALMSFALDIPQKLWIHWGQRITGDMVINDEILYGNAMSGRFDVYKQSLSELKLFGNGYEANVFTGRTVHNVPLIIVDQIGVIPALAWLFLTVFLLFKTRYKYAMLMIIGASLLDHYTWTQAALWYPAVAGVASNSIGEKWHYIFKDKV